MTSFREAELVCAVCGHTDRHTVLGSTSAFGSPDLDTRPPPLARMALALQVQCCPSCGYCARDVTRASPIARSVVGQPAYRHQLRDGRFPSLADMFLCQSMILEAEGDEAAAGWAAVHAAWACDDASDPEAAAWCRLRAARLYREAHRHGRAFADGPAREAAILADLLRRAGRYREGLAYADRGLLSSPDETTRKMLGFQQYLCRRRDSDGYTVEEALEWATESATEGSPDG